MDFHIFPANAQIPRHQKHGAGTVEERIQVWQSMIGDHKSRPVEHTRIALEIVSLFETCPEGSHLEQLLLFKGELV